MCVAYRRASAAAGLELDARDRADVCTARGRPGRRLWRAPARVCPKHSTSVTPIHLCVRLAIWLARVASHRHILRPIYGSNVVAICLCICVSVCLSIHLSIYLSLHPSINLSIYVPIYLSICPSIHPSFFLSSCLPIHLSIHSCIPPSIDRSIDPPIHESLYPSIHPKFHRSIDPSIMCRYDFSADFSPECSSHGACTADSVCKCQPGSAPALPSGFSD